MSKILANEIANYGDNAPIDLKEGLNIPAGKPIQAAGSAGSSGQILSTTGSSIAWVTPFDGSYNSLTNRPSIPAAQVNSDWNASGGVAVILNKPSVPPLPSVTTASASGGGALAYNSGNGQFTFTPPDLSNYDTAYGWGNHASAGYLTSLGDAAGVTTSKITNWDAAYSWGNHASAGYLTSYLESDTLDSVLERGSTTTRNITTTGKILYANNYDNLGDLPGASTYHGMFAHVHGTGKGYFAHAGAWTELLDINSSMADLGDVDLTVAPTDGQVLKWEQSSGSWKAANDLTGGGGGGLALTDLSASNATASGGGSLSYNSGSGAFTFTPPDLSSYLTTETDPVFSASDAAAVTSAQITNWNSAYSWGNHGSQGYLVGYGAVSNHSDVAITGASNGQLLQYNGSNWVNTTPNYLTSFTETDTLDSVLARGSDSVRDLHLTEGGELRLGSVVSGGYGQIWLASNTMYVRNINNTGAGGDIYYASRSGHHFYSGGTAGGNNCLSLTGSGVCTLKYLGSDRLTTTAAGVTIGGTVTATSFIKSGGTSSEYLMADGSVTTGGGGSGASVTISDTPPAASAGDLWWESDTGRLKIYYQDTDTTQWVDTNPPLTQDRIASSSAPSSATDTGTPGDIRYDSGYVYICISNNTWKRAALTTW
nr:tail fiber like protein [uncultured Mediterranean phage uvMED]